MDKLLELLGKYNCQLKRESDSMADFFQLNFEMYIKDLSESLDVIDNPLVGSEMCKMVKNNMDEIKNNADKIVDVLRLYNEGKIVEASIKAFEVFDVMKPQLMQRYSGAFHKENYFRIRSMDNSMFPLERKELFHIPFKKNYLVGTERYSMPGYPCIYLASQPELAWYECGKPEKFAIARFSIPQEEDDCFKFIDFSENLNLLKYSFVSWFYNEQDKALVRKYLLKNLYTYPLRAACSVEVEYKGAKFIEEYIISQLLLQWLRNDEDFDGIRYRSCSELGDVKSLGGYNVVLATKCFDKDGYDIRLRNCIKVGLPKKYDVNKLNCSQKLETLPQEKDIKSNPFLWEMESISIDFKKI